MEIEKKIVPFSDRWWKGVWIGLVNYQYIAIICVVKIYTWGFTGQCIFNTKMCNSHFLRCLN